MQRLLETVSLCENVTSIIISNNNPKVNIHDWVKTKDERVLLINQERQKGSGVRWAVANKQSSKYYIAIDDDVFMKPNQLHSLFNELKNEPDRPHGLFGSIYNNPNSYSEDNRLYQKQNNIGVDVLHQVYAVTDVHVARYIKLFDYILSNALDIAKTIEAFADDILLSRCGQNKPTIHDVGEVEECETYCSDNIALCKRPDFNARREVVLNYVYNLLKEELWII